MITGPALCQLLTSKRISLGRETAIQADIETLLIGGSLPFVREHRLAPGERIDFLVWADQAKRSGVGIECKRRGADKVRTYRQLQRYARCEVISGLILVTNTAMGLPPEIEGKPAWYVSLGAAWI